MCGALSGRYQTERACVERIEFYSRGKKRERKFYKQGSLTIRFVCYMSIVIDLITRLRVLESKRGVLCLFNWRCSGAFQLRPLVLIHFITPTLSSKCCLSLLGQGWTDTDSLCLFEPHFSVLTPSFFSYADLVFESIADVLAHPTLCSNHSGTAHGSSHTHSRSCLLRKFVCSSAPY